MVEDCLSQKFLVVRICGKYDTGPLSTMNTYPELCWILLNDFFSMVLIAIIELMRGVYIESFSGSKCWVLCRFDVECWYWNKYRGITKWYGASLTLRTFSREWNLRAYSFWHFWQVGTQEKDIRQFHCSSILHQWTDCC